MGAGEVGGVGGWGGCLGVHLLYLLLTLGLCLVGIVLYTIRRLRKYQREEEAFQKEISPDKTSV